MEKRNNSTFVRVLVFLFIAFLLFLVLISFYRNAIPFDFNAGLITVLFIITLLILSEAFDNLSIGKLFSLSREVKQKEEEVEKAKEENKDLREKIISLASVVTQNQSNHTYFGVPQEFLKGIGVVKAENEVENENEKEKEVELVDEKLEVGKDLVTDKEMTTTNGSETEPTPNAATSTSKPQKISPRDIQEEGLNRFIEKQKIPEFEVIREVEFSSNFKGIDPIGEQRIVFDAYYKTSSKEYFIEVLLSTSNHLMRRYQIYTMIAKVFFYQQVKKTSAEMILVIINLPDTLNEGRVSRNFNVGDIFKNFQPAVSNGLLRIETIDLSEDEINNIQDKYKGRKK